MHVVPEVKRWAALGAVLALIATALMWAAPSPAAASYYEDGVSFSVRIVRNSVPYRLNVKAVEEMGFTRELRVSISKMQDPSGRTALKQKQTWTFEMQEGDFTRDGDTYRIDTGSDLGPIDVDLVVNQRQGERCSKGQALFVTKPEDGAFRIESGNDVFGTITELPACASFYSFASGERPGPPPCPIDGEEMQSAPLNIKERRDDDIARIVVYDSRQQEVAPGHSTPWDVEVRGTVPAGRFDLNSDFEGSFSASGAPWLKGTATFTPRATAGRIDWYECRGEREALTLHRSGELAGDLTLDVIGYDNQRLSDPEAIAMRSRVRQLP